VQAGAIGETGQVYVLDMGEPVRIVDLARNLIRMSGRSEDAVAIVYCGLRPGEKLYEELLDIGDTNIPTCIQRLFVARLRDSESVQQVQQWLLALNGLGVSPDNAAVRRSLQAIVREFNFRS
jgi:FlaA1/EpsC-like NDP-sugar epimerase